MNYKLLFAAYIIFQILTSCSPPPPSLKLVKLKDSITAEVNYKNPQMFFYDEAFNNKKCALLLGVNHYDNVYVPVYPFSDIVNNKWYYYLYIFDTLTNNKEISPIYNEQIKVEENNFEGQITRLFHTKNGFVLVYSKLNKILFSVFDLKGNIISDKEELYVATELDQANENNTILTVLCHNDCLWLFLKNAHNYNYKGQWNIHLIKKNIHQKQNEIFYNYIQTDNGWYDAKDMNVTFFKDSLAISWIDGYRQNQNQLNLNARVYIARCSIKDTTCKNKIAISDDKDYFKIKTIFHVNNKQTNILLSENDSIWTCNTNVNENSEIKLFLLPEVEKKNYKSLFSIDLDKHIKLKLLYN